MAANGTIKNVFAIMLAGLFCWHMGSITLFPHVHIVDGVVICHSHPFSGPSDNPAHTHSQAQYETIAHLSLALLVIAAVFGALLVFRRAHRCPSLEPKISIYTTDTTVPSPRGPPYC